MSLAVRSVANVNSMVDEYGITLVRKAKIRCGLPLNMTDRWEKLKLSNTYRKLMIGMRWNLEGKVQNIVKKLECFYYCTFTTLTQYD